MQCVVVKKPYHPAVFRVESGQTATKTGNSDLVTGLYYYGARYLDPRTSRWISGDPAMGGYIPQAPVNDEAKKRNGNLPGMGGIFNVVNMHVYHYAGNNPIKLIDPDGRHTTVVITHVGKASEFFLGGTHVAAHFSNPALYKKPTFYDPNGSYTAPSTDNPDGPRESPGNSRTFTGPGSDLMEYVKYQLTEGGENRITLFTFDTTREQESAFIKNIPDSDIRFLNCAASISSLLKSLGLSFSLRPGGVESDLNKLFIKGKATKVEYTLHEENGKKFLKRTDYFYDDNKNLQTKVTSTPLD